LGDSGEYNTPETQDLKTFISKEVIGKIKKLKNKYPPISERMGATTNLLEIRSFYDLNEEFKHNYFIIVKNHKKKPKIRYFLAVLLASQSSDLLVSLAKDLLVKNPNLKLVQYSIYPKSSRVSLLCLLELIKVEDFPLSIKTLLGIRKHFRKLLDKLKNLIENQ